MFFRAVSEYNFFQALKSFKGASLRMEKVFEREGLLLFKDFAHSPSKVKATVNAVRINNAIKTFQYTFT